MSVPRQRFLQDFLFAGLVRVTSVLIGLLILGMFIQMVLIVRPLFEQPSAVARGSSAGLATHQTESGLQVLDDTGVQLAVTVSTPITLPKRNLQLSLASGPEGISIISESSSATVGTSSRRRLAMPGDLDALSLVTTDEAEQQLLLIFNSGAYRLIKIYADGRLQSGVSGSLPPHRSVLSVPGRQSWILVTEDTLEQVHLRFAQGRGELVPLRTLAIGQGLRHVSQVSPSRRLLVTTRSGSTQLWQLGMPEPATLDMLGSDSTSANWLSPVRFRVHYESVPARDYELRDGVTGVSAARLFLPVQHEGYQEPGYYWQPVAASDGFEAKLSLVPLLIGTLKAALVGLVFAIPVAVGAAVFVGYYLPSRRREQIKPFIELIASFPTVVVAGLVGLWLAPRLTDSLPEILGAVLIIPLAMMAVFGILHRLPRASGRIGSVKIRPLVLLPALVLVLSAGAVFGHWAEQWIFQGSLLMWLPTHGIPVQQLNSLLVGFVLGFAIFPVIFSLAEEAIYEVPAIGATGSIALGATPWRSFQDVVLPVAAPGIVSAVMLGFGRGVGETMIFLLLSGNAPGSDWSLFSGLRSLSATLAIELPEAAVGGQHFQILFLGALLLFILTFVINTCAQLLRQRVIGKGRVRR